MLSVIESVNAAVNNFIWGVPAMICIIGVGLYLSIRTNFLQIRKFPYAIRVTIGRLLPWEREILQVWQVLLPSEDREPYSGCGFLHFLECVQSFQK